MEVYLLTALRHIFILIYSSNSLVIVYNSLSCPSAVSSTYLQDIKNILHVHCGYGKFNPSPKQDPSEPKVEENVFESLLKTNNVPSRKDHLGKCPVATESLGMMSAT